MSSPSGGSGKKKSKHVGAGNPIKMWPTPSWQKGLQQFLGGETNGGECASSSSSANTSLTEVEMIDEEHTRAFTRNELSTQEQGTSSGSGSSGSNSRMKLLDDDLTQLNSDSDDD